MQPYKVIAFDLDGTLAESKQRVSAEMGDLLSRLLSVMPVAVMSGASFAQFKTELLASLPADANLEHLYIFPDNAAQCFVYRNNQWWPQYDHHFSDAEKKKVLDALNQALERVGLSTPPPQTWGERIEDRGAQIAFSPLGQQAPLEAKEEWHQKHEDLRKQLLAELQKLLPDFSEAEGGLTTIDITRKGITKAYGVTRFAELTGAQLSEILYVGDALEEGGNDSVVLATGVQTHTVFSPNETAALIETMLRKGAPAH